MVTSQCSLEAKQQLEANTSSRLHRQLKQCHLTLLLGARSKVLFVVGVSMRLKVC